MKKILNSSTSYVFRMVTVICMGFMIGCAGIHMNVKSYSDPESGLANYRKFVIVPTDKENPLLETELLYMIKKKLASKGFEFTEENPDFVVTLDYYVGPFQYYEAPTTLYIPQYTVGESTSYSGTVDDAYYNGSSYTSGKWESKPITYGGGSRTSYYRKMIISIVDAEVLRTTGEIEVVWRGDVDSSGSSSDIRKVAPFLIDEALNDFPVGASAPTKRVRSMDSGLPKWMK